MDRELERTGVEGAVSSERKLRIGIVGSGRIAERFVPEAGCVASVIVAGVYNPHRESAARFAKKWGIACFENPDALFDHSDAVYVATPHETHYDYAASALRRGKHVLCEKPLFLKKAQAEELFTYAGERRLVLLEGIKTAYCPGFLGLTEAALGGKIGQVRYIDACFTKLERADKRELTDQKYGGSFTELGSYCLLPILRLFGTRCRDIQFAVINGENGLDHFTKASFAFAQGIATATCGLGVKSEGRLLVAGTGGYLVAKAPWWKTAGFEVHYEDAGRVDRYTMPFQGDGLRYEIEAFRDRIMGNEGSGGLSAEESVAMAGIMEQFLEGQKRELP